MLLRVPKEITVDMETGKTINVKYIEVDENEYEKQILQPLAKRLAYELLKDKKEDKESRSPFHPNNSKAK